MLALGCRYLMGLSVAALPDDPAQPEWPPHPARAFMALVAAHFATGADPEERAALEWLEAQPPCHLYAGIGHDRVSALRFVPANDRAGPSRGQLQSAPGLTRKKSERTFATAWLEDDRVFFIHPAECPDAVQAPLSRLCSKVTRVGHSSSLVEMWVEPDPPEPNWMVVPDTATKNFRVPTTGLLARLERAFLEDATRRPVISSWEPYGPPSTELREDLGQTIWSEHPIVLSLEPLETPYRHLDLVSILGISEGLHRAVLDTATDPVPEIISGHRPDGAPSEKAHIAYLPLAFVAHEHADGLIRGLGVAVPRGADREERRAILAALGRLRELRLGRLGRWNIRPETRDPAPVTLRPWAWTGGRTGARAWATVTPVVFDRHPREQDAESYDRAVREMLGRAIRRIGLPIPARITTLSISPHLGVPASHDFPRLRRKDGSERRHIHVFVRFDQPVQGPIALGAGRYRGYGFMRPVRNEGVDARWREHRERGGGS